MKEPVPTERNPRGKFVPGIAIALLCCGVIWVGLMLGPFADRTNRVKDEQNYQPRPTAQPRPGETSLDGKILPTASPTGLDSFPEVPPTIVQLPIPEAAVSSLANIFSATVPVHDYFAATEELGRVDPGERVVEAGSDRIGNQRTFFTNDGARQAELVYADDLAAYWVEIGLDLDRTALVTAAERLRERYYPILNRNFGQEWKPGVDGDLRFTVLHILGAPDTYELGYFTDENQYPRALFPHSNEREMIYLNMTQLGPGALYDGTLVHEVQHLIQWNLDANEDKWLNEGLSQIAESMSGLDTVDPEPYLEQTRIRLDQWPDDSPDIYAHYAGSYLYLLYLWEQLGDAAITELARHPANGLSAVRAVLGGHQPERSLESFTADWATALFLDGRSPDPRYRISAHDLPQPFFANRVRQLPFDGVSSLDQFAIDVIDLDFSGPATLTFAGDTVVEVAPAPPDGEPFWYAPPDNSGRSQLTADIDLSDVSSAMLSFAVWYDLEPGYDFAYLSVSTDGGQTWQPLDPRHGIVGAYGPAWGGHSVEMLDHQNGWLEEQVNLDAYAGRPIAVRFDVLTDFEEVNRGFAVTDINITQLAAQPDWRPSGFVRTGSVLPQTWEVRLIRHGGGSEVIPLSLDGFNRNQTSVDLGQEGGALIVVPLNPFVESTAEYWLSISR